MHGGSNQHLKWQLAGTGPIPSDRLKNLRDVDKWSFLRLFQLGDVIHKRLRF